MKIRHDVILQVVTSFSYIYSPIMTPSTKMLTSAEKYIKDILNKYQTEFGYKPIKIEKIEWGPNRPPAPNILQITRPR